MRMRNVLKGSLINLFVTPLIWAAPVKITSCPVTFNAYATPGRVSIEGTGATCTGHLENDGKSITGDVTVPMKTFTTGIDFRDTHMREKYLNVDTYPDAVLKITKFDTASLKKDETYPFSGTLKLHGVEKEVAGTVLVEDTSGGNTALKVSYPVSLATYGIVVPVYLGVTVADKVEVTSKIAIESAPVAAAAPAGVKGTVKKDK